MDIEYTEVEILNEGWSEDRSGLPVFTAGSITLIGEEIDQLRANEGWLRLRLSAVLTEASDKRFYGDNTLRRVADENQISYGTARKMVAAYRRLRDLPLSYRKIFVAALKEGELYWSKLEIAAPVKDDEKYIELLHASADGSLSNSKLRKEVASCTGLSSLPDTPRPRVKPVMTNIDCAWLAGLLEGEAHFPLKRPGIELMMTDFDVVERAANITGVGRLATKFQHPPNQDLRRWQVHRIEDVKMVLHAILPYMGKRRRERILELLKAATLITGQTN